MKSKLLATIALIIVAALAFSSIGIAYTATTQNTGNTISSEYAVLSQTYYNFTQDKNGFAYDTIVSKYEGCTYVANSDENQDTVIEFTVSDRDTLKENDVLKIWVTSRYGGYNHFAGITVSIGTGDDTILQVPVGTTTTRDLQYSSTTEGEYHFKLTVIGMTHQPSVNVSISKICYRINGIEGPLMTINNEVLGGKLLGIDTLTANRVGNSGDIQVSISSQGFSDMTGKGWMYVLKVTGPSDVVQYAYSTNGENWTLQDSGHLNLSLDTKYEVELYFAGKYIQDQKYIQSSYEPCNSEGILIRNGTVTYTSDSGWGN